MQSVAEAVQERDARGSASRCVGCSRTAGAEPRRTTIVLNEVNMGFHRQIARRVGQHGARSAARRAARSLHRRAATDPRHLRLARARSPGASRNPRGAREARRSARRRAHAEASAGRAGRDPSLESGRPSGVSDARALPDWRPLAALVLAGCGGGSAATSVTTTPGDKPCQQDPTQAKCDHDDDLASTGWPQRKSCSFGVGDRPRLLRYAGSDGVRRSGRR